jgi:protein-S-isoprenylcysteine O-methyltransferase Ste14
MTKDPVTHADNPAREVRGAPDPVRVHRTGAGQMSGAQLPGSITAVVIAVYLCYQVWHAPLLSTAGKVGWTIFSLCCGIIALIAWFVIGRRRAYGHPSWY